MKRVNTFLPDALILLNMSILKHATITLLLIASFSSCKEKECPCEEIINLPKEKICNVDNPLTDLPWLEKIVSDRKEFRNSIRIYLVTYKEGSGFLQEFVLDCCELFGGCDCDGISHYFRNCEGYVLCDIEGMWGATPEQLYRLSNSPNFYNRECREENLEIDFETMKLIYEYKCNLNN